MAFSPKLYIRVTMSDDGRTPKLELMANGVKVADLSRVELIEFLMQATSALRW